jgi:G3E family GTPase
MFRRAAMMIVNKTDLLGFSDFSLERVQNNARSINPDLQILSLSCRTGSGVDAWIAWLTDLILRLDAFRRMSGGSEQAKPWECSLRSFFPRAFFLST